MKSITKIIFFIVIVTFSQVCLKYGVNTINHDKIFAIKNLLNIWLLLGILSYFFIINLTHYTSNWKLGHNSVSMGGLLYFILPVAAFIFLDEYLNIFEWIGITLISIGIILTSWE